MEQKITLIKESDLFQFHFQYERNTKSIPCAMVLQLMDTIEYSNDYCGALELTLKVFNVDRKTLEAELNQYI